jgi:hypothetical protein
MWKTIGKSSIFMLLEIDLSKRRVAVAFCMKAEAISIHEDTRERCQSPYIEALDFRLWEEIASIKWLVQRNSSFPMAFRNNFELRP